MNVKHILVAILVSWGCFGQTSQIHNSIGKSYRKATELYQEHLFMPSRFWYEKSSESSSDYLLKQRDLYRAILAGIRAGIPNANQQMTQFIDDYPISPLSGSATMEIADFYFQKADYGKVLQWYNNIEDYEVDWSSKDKYHFQKGYSLFINKKNEQAQKYLSQVKYSPVYGTQAQYYLGFIAYDNGDFSTAKDHFSKIENNNPLSAKLSYYKAYMNFKEGHFSQAISEGIAQLKNNPSASEKSELNKIIGESYFNLKQYSEALPYLRQYKGKHGKFSNTDYYYIGYALYSKGDYLQAISFFNKIVGAKDKVAQNAYYHLGECYLKMNKKQEALNAFRNASQLDFDANITQNSFLNYAKLSYDIGNSFESVPQVLKSYIDRYDQDKEEVEDLLLSAYLTSKNYESALQLLEKSTDVKSKKIYQKVAFLYGIQQYNDKKYNKAAELFKKAEKPIYTNLSARSQFWYAECLYQMKQREKSLRALYSFMNNAIAKQLPEYEKALYTLGYIYFQNKYFNKSVEYLEQFIAVSKSSVKKADACLRIGDSYFALGKYALAVEAYKKSISFESNRSDYAQFQVAMAYGLINDNAQKINALDYFIRQYNTSSLRPNALYELANTWAIQSDNEKAAEIYHQIQQQYPHSSLVSKAMLREGLIYYNQEKPEQALHLLKAVAETFPNTTEATQAVSTVKLIYIDMGQVDSYAQWVKQLPFVDISNQELDNATFESAEKQYVLQKADHAIKGFENYLQQFSEGIHATEAQFYLAQLYEKQEQWQKALPLLKKVVQGTNNSFSEVALVKICQIQIAQKQTQQAISSLTILEQKAQYTENILYAKANLMRLYFEEKDFKNAIVYANEICSFENASQEVISDAHYILAHSYFETNDLQNAQKQYQIVLKEASGERAAEALYFKAYFEHQNQQYKRSNQTIQQIAKQYGEYKYFSAKSLVLMAQNFEALDDSYQAHFILENVIKNFEAFPQVTQQAEKLLKKVKEKAAQNNSSIEVEPQ